MQEIDKATHKRLLICTDDNESFNFRL